MSTDKTPPPSVTAKTVKNESGSEEVKENVAKKETEKESEVKKPEIESLFNISSTTAKELQEKYKPTNISFEEAREAAWKSINLQKRHFEDKLESLRVIFNGKSDTPRTPDEEWYYKRVSFWMKRYENFVGLTDVKASQAKVVQCEARFIEMQEKRRESQNGLAEIQKNIKDIHIELDKTHRGDDKYLVLITQEHNVLKEENNLLEQFKFFEKAERESFAALSNSVRDSHEKERAQAEKTKYWSLLGSIIGTCVGVLGTTINNRMRMRELRQLVAKNSTVEEVQIIGAELIESLDSHEKELSDLTVKVEHVLNQAKSGLTNLEKIEGLADAMHDSSKKISTGVLEQNLSILMKSQEKLSQLIDEHQQVIQENIERMKTDLIVQSTNVNNLAHIQLKDRERDKQIRGDREIFMKKSFDSITKQNSDLQHCINSYSKEIDDKVKDVRSMLINDQRIPKLEDRLVDKIKAMEETQQAILKKQNILTIQTSEKEKEKPKPVPVPVPVPVSVSKSKLELESITAVLEEHHERTRQTVILSTLMVAVFTPLAVFCASKML